jgi:hypothetical protein
LKIEVTFSLARSLVRSSGRLVVWSSYRVVAVVGCECSFVACWSRLVMSRTACPRWNTLVCLSIAVGRANSRWRSLDFMLTDPLVPNKPVPEDDLLYERWSHCPSPVGDPDVSPDKCFPSVHSSLEPFRYSYPTEGETGSGISANVIVAQRIIPGALVDDRQFTENCLPLPDGAGDD